MAENIQDIEQVADVNAAADIKQANQADLFKNTLETAYDKIIDTISGGDRYARILLKHWTAINGKQWRLLTMKMETE